MYISSILTTIIWWSIHGISYSNMSLNVPAIAISAAMETTVSGVESGLNLPGRISTAEVTVGVSTGVCTLIPGRVSSIPGCSIPNSSIRYTTRQHVRPQSKQSWTPARFHYTITYKYWQILIIGHYRLLSFNRNQNTDKTLIGCFKIFGKIKISASIPAEFQKIEI